MIVFSKSKLSHLFWVFSIPISVSVSVLSSVTLRTLLLYGIELHWIGASWFSATKDRIYKWPCCYHTRKQFSIFSTISPTLNSFPEAQHFADLPCIFLRVPFCGFLKEGYTRNTVARFLFGVSKGTYKFSRMVIGKMLNIFMNIFIIAEHCSSF